MIDRSRAASRAACLILLAISVAGCGLFAPSTARTPKRSTDTESAQTKVEVKTEGAAPEVPPLKSPGQPVPPQPAVGPTLSVGPVRPVETAQAPAAPAPTPVPVPPPAPPARERPPTARAEATASPGGSPERLIVFNFDNADVEVVIQAAAEIVGFNYVLAPAARGRKVTVQTIGKIASADVFNVLLTILDVNGLAAVRSGSLYRIIPREGAPQTPVRTIVGREMDPDVPGDQVLTQIVRLQYVSAAEAVTLLRPFVPAQGAVSAHRDTNLLLLTDTAANIRRLLDIVRLIDVALTLDEPQIIKIQHADAQEMAQLLSQLFVTGRVRTGGAPSVPAPPVPTPGVAPRPAAEGGAGADRVPLIVAERRSNSIVVYASKQDTGAIQRLIEKLDVDIYGGQRVFIYFAENSKVKDLAATLDAIYGRGDRPQTSPAPSAAGYRPGAVPPPPTSPPTALPSARPAGAGLATLAGEVGPAVTDIRFIADEVTNAIIVTTHPRLYKEIEETIKKLDRMPRQVLIEVLAAEVVLTDDTKLGIEWAVRNGRFAFTNTQNSVSGSNLSNAPSLPGQGLIPGGSSLGGGLVPVGFNMFTFAASEFIAALNALATENRVNVLSSPSIMTSENKKAIINVSTSVPIVTSQQVPVSAGGDTGNSITQSVEYKDAGIILTVTPRIGEAGTVSLDVKQEVNDVGENEPPPINSPRFRKREAETSVVLLNNQTLVLGGLIQNKRTRIRTGIPFLNRIPVLGYLFGATEEKIEKTELLMLITPRVVGTAIDAARITEQMRRGSPEMEQSFKLVPPKPPAPLKPLPMPPPSR
jgi:general secretion pathway protein D